MTQYELSYLFQLGIDNLFEANTLFFGTTSAAFVAVHAARKSLNPVLVTGIIVIYTAVTLTNVQAILAVTDRLILVAADVSIVAATSGKALSSTSAYSADLWPGGSGYVTAAVYFLLWASAVYYALYAYRRRHD